MTTHPARDPSSFIVFRHAPGHVKHNPTHNPAGRHAWVMVGKETIFLCHLIMGWMQGHNYEVVLEVSIPDQDLTKILNDRARNGHTHFLGNQGDPARRPDHGHEPDRAGHGDAETEAAPLFPMHSIPGLFSGRVERFRADVWNYFPAKACSMEWPYPPGTEFLTNVDVTVLRVVHYRHINLNIAAQRYESYLLFGREDEAHVYHNVVDQPDYDHVATLAAAPRWLQDEQLEAGVIVSVPSLPWSAQRTRCVNPLPDGTIHPVLYHGIRRYRDHTLQNPKNHTPVPVLEIDVERTWWFSTRVVNWPPEGPCGGLGDIPTPFWPPVNDGDCPGLEAGLPGGREIAQ